MIRTVLLASAFAFASPALAQQTEMPAEPMMDAPAEATTEVVTETPAPDGAMPDTATTTTTAEATAPANATTQVAQVVEADFPSYDLDKNGELSQAEFAEWMLKLKAASPAQQGATTAEADLKAWTGQAFAQADVDKSQAVSKGELTTFLSG
ncbi:EF-hand domain-containing protein [Sphingobium boeckii]|uniref:Ethanolamine ammonia-lyase small subunit n=1 Tax=Sphingobium boeckii TaxID=1082345 RepID=A0A7W9EFE3_9SPHN|nr:EF-hand domain-containing protein [Sphingobium boeckii]MBB5687004.1 ethanolamine ammonia-lyase small subunit [Sphingobium boeckii]